MIETAGTAQSGIGRRRRWDTGDDAPPEPTYCSGVQYTLQVCQRVSCHAPSVALGSYPATT
jgi:hypothetical protein